MQWPLALTFIILGEYKKLMVISILYLIRVFSTSFILIKFCSLEPRSISFLFEVKNWITVTFGDILGIRGLSRIRLCLAGISST